LSADALAQVLRPLEGIFQSEDYPDLLVGLGEPDDAAVWRLDDERALVVTTDFFTPVVDDPYDYGAIAAANSLSDVYAMGARPFLALNVAAFPPDLPVEVAQEILRGGAEKARQAGVVIAGGHTIQDEEPKYGLIALGLVEPARMATKKGAQPGDHLVLTKPLGFGVTTTALKNGQAAPEHVAEAVEWMARLNKDAGQLASRLSLRCVTDVTGFGFLGHAWEIARASAVGLQVWLDQVPFLSGARGYAESWSFPGGSLDNREHFGAHVRFQAGIDEPNQMLLFDAQTSGGLLLSVPPAKLIRLKEEAAALEQPLWEVGRVVSGAEIQVRSG
jgi:selenide,water dikinase